MAQGRKKNSRRRGVKPSERAAAQAQRQNEKAERKDRIQHILVVAFAVIMALGMLIPSLAAIFGGNDQAQQITDSEGNVFEISSDGTITLISSPTVADLDAEFGPQIEELVSTLEKKPGDAETLRSLADKSMTWGYRVMRKATNDEELIHANDLLSQAIGYYDSYLEGNESKEAYVSRAMCRHYMGETDAAIADLTTLLTTEDYSIAWANLGLLYEVKGDTASALDAYQKAIEADPDDADGAKSYAENRISRINGTDSSSTPAASGSLEDTLRSNTGIGF
ncbi:MAG: tetratricopeptide repeat protein [Atopobiaceae bacterium]|nr:tetratricopeptide repeat protein [Atopobiaceae bacterium]